jgi:hypothetical protein
MCTVSDPLSSYLTIIFDSGRFLSYFLSGEYTYRDSEECYASVVHNGTENHSINNIKEAHVLGRLCWNFFVFFEAILINKCETY